MSSAARRITSDFPGLERSVPERRKARPEGRPSGEVQVSGLDYMTSSIGPELSPAIERIKTQIADINRQQANLRTTLGPR